MFGEYEAMSVFQALEVVGVGVFFATYALLVGRAFGGDSLVYFIGNAVAAVLFLAASAGNYDVADMLARMAAVAVGFALMIGVFLIEISRTRYSR